MLVNRAGGTAARLGEAELRRRLARAFAEAGVRAELVFAQGGALPALARAALADARAGGLDAVVVGGGDGSVGTIAGVLAGTSVPLGVLPLGTRNHFARDLGLPPEPEAAAEALARALPRAVDVGEVNGRVFVNNSVLGVYPYLVAERERGQEGLGIGKWPATALAFLRLLARFPRRRLRIQAEGWSRPYRTPCLFVGVNEYELEPFRLPRREVLDGGRLWLLVARHRGPLRFAWFAFRASFRGLKPAKDFEVFRVTAAEVRPKATRLPVACDGEVERMRGPLRYRIRPGDLLVLAPPAA